MKTGQRRFFGFTGHCMYFYYVYYIMLKYCALPLPELWSNKHKKVSNRAASPGQVCYVFCKGFGKGCKISINSIILCFFYFLEQRTYQRYLRYLNRWEQSHWLQWCWLYTRHRKWLWWRHIFVHWKHTEDKIQGYSERVQPKWRKQLNSQPKQR